MDCFNRRARRVRVRSGSRAGRYPSRDPLQPLRAALADSDTLKAAVALGSAVAMLNIADRGPDRPEVAVAPRSKPPRGLVQRMRVVRYEWRLPTTLIDGLPVHQPATILVHIAHRPTQVRSWGAVLEILPALTEAVTPDALRIELTGRPKATSTRLAYLIASIAPNLLTTFAPQRSRGLVWFGPRRRSLRYDNDWNVADTILPVAVGREGIGLSVPTIWSVRVRTIYHIFIQTSHCVRVRTSLDKWSPHWPTVELSNQRARS